MKTKLNRRELILNLAKGTAGIYGLQLLSPWQTHALAATGDLRSAQFFFLISVQGSMDVTLGLDGQVHAPGIDEKDVYLEYRPQDLKRIGNLALGPAAEALHPWIKSSCVINGINMRADVGHETLRNYIASGKGDGTANCLPIELGMAIGTGPMGVVSSSPDFGSRTSQVAVISPGDLKSSSSSSGALADQVRSLHSRSFSFSAISGLLDAVERRKQFAADTSNLPSIQEPSDNDDAASYKSEMEAAQIIALAFKNGLALQGVLDIDRDPQLDTHSGHVGTHLKIQKNVWKEVADIFEMFSAIPFGQGSLFDATTFMVTTEFSRTPFLNGNKGKDHNPYTNSILLTGKGIQGGRAVGASQVISRKQVGSGMHIGSAFDYKTGQSIPRGTTRTDLSDVDMIRPENIARTIAKLFNDPTGMGGLSYKTRVIPGVLKA